MVDEKNNKCCKGYIPSNQKRGEQDQQKQKGQQKWKKRKKCKETWRQMEGANGTHLTHWGLWIVVDNESSKCGWKRNKDRWRWVGIDVIETWEGGLGFVWIKGHIGSLGGL